MAVFTYRFTSKTRQPKGHHAFDQACMHGIKHLTWSPANQRLVERFNGCISELIQQA
jgi:type IV secretory pathway VirD2 relaxase